MIRVNQSEMDDFGIGSLVLIFAVVRAMCGQLYVLLSAATVIEYHG